MAEDINEHDAAQVLSHSQVDEFLKKGVLVVGEILSADELRDAKDGLRRTLLSYGVDTHNLAETGQNLQQLSSTNGSGGVLDLFYPTWKLRVAANKRLFRATCELWEAAYCHQGESLEELSDDQVWRWHPYGPFDCHKGYMYVDRIGFRIPTRLAEQLGSSNNDNSKKSKPIQRSLTPHLDCCPENLFADTSKWRPIQCFVSLTDDLEPNTGGFEAVPGFHVEFDAWARNRSPSTVVRKTNGHREEINIPAPCIGNYTHIRPKEDAELFSRVRHIPGVRAGSAVFWDNRIPHANAYRHNGEEPRAVVYSSFLPDVALNRQYVERQRWNYHRRRQPTDQWINTEERQEVPPADECDYKEIESSSCLFRKLMGIDEW